MKKRIAFLYSGQIRSNNLSDASENDSFITDSWLLNVFNDEFKSKYDYDIFISTNTIDIERTKKFFGENNVKNIHLIESNYYLKPIDNHIPPIEFLNNIHYSNVPPSERHWIKNHSLWQSYRMYDVMNLFKNYIKSTNQNYDIVCRSRLDTPFKKNMLFVFDELINNQQLQSITFSDIFTIGRPEIMINYMNVFEDKFIYYGQNCNYFNDWSYFIYTRNQHYEKSNDRWWKYAPEKIYTERILDYCRNNNINPNEALKGYKDWEDYVIIYQRSRFEI